MSKRQKIQRTKGKKGQIKKRKEKKKLEEEKKKKKESRRSMIKQTEHLHNTQLTSGDFFHITKGFLLTGAGIETILHSTCVLTIDTATKKERRRRKRETAELRR